jgi:hypothetical protein
MAAASPSARVTVGPSTASTQALAWDDGALTTHERATITGVLRRALIGWWRTIVPALLVGAVVLVCLVPAAFAAVTGAPLWLVGAATLPFTLALTGTASFAAAVARESLGGDRARLRAATRLDPVLGVVGAGLASASGAALAGPGSVPLVGAGLSAVVLFVSPLVLAYGSVRKRPGFAAIRGGLILAAYRPSWALSLLAMDCLGGFAVAASAGVLLLIVPAVLLVIATALVSDELREIDEPRGARP